MTWTFGGKKTVKDKKVNIWEGNTKDKEIIICWFIDWFYHSGKSLDPGGLFWIHNEISGEK